MIATAEDATSEDVVIAEFEELAATVRATGAQIVEANLSCPNVREREAEAYRDAALAGRIAAALRRGAGDLPVLLKVGPIEEDAAMAAFLRAVAPAADGVVMINAPRRLVQTSRGSPPSGPDANMLASWAGASTRSPSTASGVRSRSSTAINWA